MRFPESGQFEPSDADLAEYEFYLAESGENPQCQNREDGMGGIIIRQVTNSLCLNSLFPIPKNRTPKRKMGKVWNPK